MRPLPPSPNARSGVVTIAAPGPSLYRKQARALPHVDIAVNIAIRFIACDWLVSHDCWKPERKPTHGVVTFDRHMPYWQKQCPGTQVINAREYDGAAYFSGVSAINHAIKLAGDRNASRIDIYGMDLAGAQYCDGSPLKIGDEYFIRHHWEDDRKLQERWAREHYEVAHAIRRANDRGVGVVMYP